MSEYKSKLLDLIKDMPDEDFNELVIRFEKLNGQIELLAAHLSKLGLGDPTGEIETPAEGLCASCANPCNAKTVGKMECREFSEFTEEFCPNCEYWDVSTCMYGGTCRGGEHYYPKAQINV